ncbi:NAD(+) diphosphatase [Collinsella ihumii]|uniref:NAD(+) diphosphatase n=1 Tax=Collinsella ihumii TaxID=1720204 RepID=A0AAW7JZA3_9ACTN|nr:NAD(+) diphosphatase [Collinsella ihumii]MDN0068317.1 NAD(+) diphosphatase [Collinsella ihumii]
MSADSAPSMFAHVGALTSLPLSQTVVDLDVDRRGDEGLLDRLVRDAATRVVLVDGACVAVPKQHASCGTGELSCTEDPAAPRPDAQAPTGELELALLSAPDIGELAGANGLLMVYLGIDRTEMPAVSYLGIDVTPRTTIPRDDVPAAGHEPACDDRVRSLRERFDWIELRSFAPCASARDVGLATSAVAVCTWQRSQRFCPACGAPVRPILSGWAQACTNPHDAKRLLFPRIEPAVITAIVDDEDRILLQHNRAWRPRFHSVSAGFVEAGESLEHAVRREAMEEVGIEIGEVRYLGSQAWPFPASIMLGFRAHALSGEVRVDHEEVGEARWFTREELEHEVGTGAVEPPGRASIARHMIEQWLGHELQGR